MIKREDEKILREIKNSEEQERKEKLDKEMREMVNLEKKVLKRLKEKKKIPPKEEIGKQSEYVKISNKLFSKTSLSLYRTPFFNSMKKDIIKGNLPFLPVSYISTILFTTILSVVVAFAIFIFLLFFNLQIDFPFVSMYSGEFLSRLTKVFWVLLIIPLSTFFIMYIYPSIEKNFIKGKVEQELPFVAIHMSSIAGSMVEPSKIFEIITMTGEYPYVSKELKKIINGVNIYGYNLVNAIKQTAINTSSYKFSELLNGISTTITSGGDLERYFEKKAQSLLFDYRLEREKYTRTAETFMDIYISVVIAAPMILMLLLLMIKISGFGIDITTQMITIIIITIVSVINVIFLTFLNLKQPGS